MIDITPKKLIKREDLNKWEQYHTNLNKYTYVNKYMGGAFKKWVETLSNPLYIPWIIQLLNDNMAASNNYFMQLENDMGEVNLGKIYDELKDINTNFPEQIIAKYYSLVGEVKIFYQLAKQNTNLEKINRYGDWKSNNKIVAVKSISTLDFNYSIIESIIKGLYYVEENKELRYFNSISLKEGNGIDYIFRNKISWYLDTELLNHIKYFASESKNWDYIRVDTTKYYIENSTQKGYLDVLIEVHRQDNRIDLYLKEDRAGEAKEEHKIKLILESKRDCRFTLDIDNDQEMWWGSPRIEQNKLGERIIKFVQEFDKGFKKTSQSGLEFDAWIIIPIHPKHEDYIIQNNNELLSYYRSIVGAKNYNLNIMFSMEKCFDSKGPVILEMLKCDNSN